MKQTIIRHSRKIIYSILFLALFYGIGRVYYEVTAGFSLTNIVSDLPYEKERETRALSVVEEAELRRSINQPYFYLGKGCQSYVFLSEDGQYVCKFFKYQRFRPQGWLIPFTSLPMVKEYLDKKKARKQKKLKFFMSAWKVAFDELKEESGLIYVHLNKSHHLNQNLIIYDKLGFKHILNADDMEFLIQRKADMLRPYIQREMSRGEEQKVIHVLDDLVSMIFSEYKKGVADNDHALMQNTGVYNHKPFHIDVGQFVLNESVKDPKIHNQEIYNKFYKFKEFLHIHYPNLDDHLTRRLKEQIGADYNKMKPYFGRQHD